MSQVISKATSIGPSPIPISHYTLVNFGMSPYTVTSTDQYIAVDSSGGSVVLKFPNAPGSLRNYIVKDKTGNATVNNISITTVGGAVTFDGLTTYKIAGNYGSIQILMNPAGTYEIF